MPEAGMSDETQGIRDLTPIELTKLLIAGQIKSFNITTLHMCFVVHCLNMT